MSKKLDIQRIKITNKGRNTLCDRLTRTVGEKCGKEEEEVRETATPRRREKPGRARGQEREELLHVGVVAPDAETAHLDVNSRARKA